jgi:uncharacterized protein (TIGR00661 family)
MSLRVLFCVQGEGRGHMTQAITLAGMLRDAGHEVVATQVGNAEGGDVPEFFSRRMATPIHTHASPVIRLNGEARELDVPRTLATGIRRLPEYAASLRVISRAVDRYRPDLVVNFYEPLVGLVVKRARQFPPVACIAHQYMFHHDRYPFEVGSPFQRRGMLTFTDLTSAGADRLLALSLYPAADVPERKIRVVPPLLRPELFEKTPTVAEDPFLLVYLWRPQLYPEILAWSESEEAARGGVRVHCFMDHPRRVLDERVNDVLTVHHLNDGLFLDLMASCSGVATTSGFETMSEAMYLGKPLLMVPTHIEQQCNARDAEAVGAGLAADSFDLARIMDFAPSDQSGFRGWVDQASGIFVSELEKTAAITSRR